MNFPDIHNGLIDWLKATFPELADPDGEVDYHVGGERPRPGESPTLRDRGLFILCEIATGTDNRVTDFVTVRIEAFGTSRAAIYSLSEEIRTEILAAPFVAGGVAVDNATTRMRPIKLPWDGDGVGRYGATYELSVRRR